MVLGRCEGSQDLESGCRSLRDGWVSKKAGGKEEEMDGVRNRLAARAKSPFNLRHRERRKEGRKEDLHVPALLGAPPN